MTNDDDNEWEYEYDETETEDFYIPIDLSDVPSAQVPVNAERKQGHPTLLKSRLRALNAARGQLPDTITEDSGTSTQEKETTSIGEVQITGLHTANPLLMYNGQLLSCHWASTIGTDMFFARPQAEDGSLEQPLRSLPSVDLLSLGTAKLVAKIGRLRPRDDVYEGEDDVQTMDVAVESIGNNQDAAVAPSSTAPDNLQRASTGRPSTLTSFIARLNEAKARRGETTRLVIAHTPDGSRLVSEPVNEPARLVEDGSLQAAGDVPIYGT
jgi:hypothetical protein